MPGKTESKSAAKYLICRCSPHCDGHSAGLSEDDESTFPPRCWSDDVISPNHIAFARWCTFIHAVIRRRLASATRLSPGAVPGPDPLGAGSRASSANEEWRRVHLSPREFDLLAYLFGTVGALMQYGCFELCGVPEFGVARIPQVVMSRCSERNGGQSRASGIHLDEPWSDTDSVTRDP